MTQGEKFKKREKCKCFTGDTFREELLENCLGVVLVGYCCCGNVRAVLGELSVVGRDFIVLDNPRLIPIPSPSPGRTADQVNTNNNANIVTRALIIPLARIFSFVEIEAPLVENDCSKVCASDKTLIEHLAKEHCGDFVQVEVCTCLNEGPVCVFGNLVEVGCDFIEVRVEDVALCPGGPFTPGGGFAEAMIIAKTLVNSNISTRQINLGIGDAVIRIKNVCSIFINPPAVAP